LNAVIPTGTPWLPDGIISNQISQFGNTLEGLGLENVGTYYGHLEYISAIRNDNLSVKLVHFFPVLVSRKIWQP
jgi:hypothetical protein